MFYVSLYIYLSLVYLNNDYQYTFLLLFCNVITDVFNIFFSLLGLHLLVMMELYVSGMSRFV